MSSAWKGRARPRGKQPSSVADGTRQERSKEQQKDRLHSAHKLRQAPHHLALVQKDVRWGSRSNRTKATEGQLSQVQPNVGSPRWSGLLRRRASGRRLASRPTRASPVHVAEPSRAARRMARSSIVSRHRHRSRHTPPFPAEVRRRVMPCVTDNRSRTRLAPRRVLARPKGQLRLTKVRVVELPLRARARVVRLEEWSVGTGTD